MRFSKGCIAAICISTCLLFLSGCEEKVKTKTEGISAAQKSLFDSFGRIVDSLHSPSQLSAHYAKGFKPDSATLNALKKVNVSIFEPATDIKVNGNDANVTVRIMPIGADMIWEDAPTKEWKMTKEGEKWKLKEISG